MSELTSAGQAIADTVERILAAHCSAEQLRAVEGGWNTDLWHALLESGATLALEPAGAGQFDLPVADAFNIIRLASAHAAPIPLAETMLANWLLLSAGLGHAEATASVTGVDRRDRIMLTRAGEGWRIDGTAAAVPWARFADQLIAGVDIDGTTHVARIPKTAFTTTPGENIAREPRDAVAFSADLPIDAVATVGWPLAYLRAMGAAIRVVQISGCLDSVLALTVRYTGERVQFGRAISKFQAVQQNIAIMGGQIAAARAAVATIARDFGDPVGWFGVAAAKTRVAEAIAITSRFAHQAHGAIGITQEYDLHFRTKRLWAWREEFGNEVEWGGLLGREVLRRGADAMWSFVTDELRSKAICAPEEQPSSLAIAV